MYYFSAILKIANIKNKNKAQNKRLGMSLPRTF